MVNIRNLKDYHTWNSTAKEVQGVLWKMKESSFNPQVEVLCAQLIDLIRLNLTQQNEIESWKCNMTFYNKILINTFEEVIMGIIRFKRDGDLKHLDKIEKKMYSLKSAYHDHKYPFN